MVLVVLRQQQCIATHVVDDRFQVQPGAYLNGSDPVAIGFYRRAKLADTGLIGA
ncbi:hypothetical protein D3C71_2100720 [compost metagenome]